MPDAGAEDLAALPFLSAVPPFETEPDAPPEPVPEPLGFDPESGFALDPESALPESDFDEESEPDEESVEPESDEPDSDAGFARESFR